MGDKQVSGSKALEVVFYFFKDKVFCKNMVVASLLSNKFQYL